MTTFFFLTILDLIKYDIFSSWMQDYFSLRPISIIINLLYKIFSVSKQNISQSLWGSKAWLTKYIHRYARPCFWLIRSLLLESTETDSWE